MNKLITFEANSKEEYYNIVLSTVNDLTKICRESDILALAILCTKANEQGIVILSPLDRKVLEKRLGYTTQSFSNSLNRLKKAGLVLGKSTTLKLNIESLIDDVPQFLTNPSYEIKITIEYDNVPLF